MAKWWSSRITKKQKYTYYSISLIWILGVIIALIAAFLTQNDKLFASISFFFIGLFAITDGIYAGFYLKEYPKIFPDIVKLEGLSAELKGIMFILLGLLSLYVSLGIYIKSLT